jgi:hypothetical protein
MGVPNLPRSDTPKDTLRDLWILLYCIVMRHRNDDNRCLTCQRRSAP